jgi:cell division protein FtsN
MLAGAPVQLNVTALIRETVDEEPEIVVEDATAELPETSEISETSLDPIEGAAAAIDASEPIPTVIDEEATAIPTVIETEEEPAKKKGFKWPWAKPEPEVVAPVGDVAAATAVAAASTAPDVAAPEPAAAPKPRKSQLDKPYIQIGIFSVEENANRTASQMRNAGIIPTVFEQSANGKPFWRVVVGPSYTSSERSALLEKAKEIGFSDAYYVTN